MKCMKDSQKQPERVTIQEMSQVDPYAGAMTTQEFFKAVQEFQQSSEPGTVAARKATSDVLRRMHNE